MVVAFQPISAVISAGTVLDLPSVDELFSGIGMKQINVTEMLGTRIVSTARMAVAIHLALPDEPRPGSERTLEKMAKIGGTDRRVTDDPLSLSVVSGPLSVVNDQNN
jgi:hypothetical protein